MSESRKTLSIRTKSIFEPAFEEDGARYLITRYHPRGIKKDHYDQWIRELSPSPELLFDYKEKRIDWEQFKERLITELSTNIDSLEAINALHNDMKWDNMTLLCFEKPGVPCHRYIIMDLIRDPKKLMLMKNSDNQKGRSVKLLVAD